MKKKILLSITKKDKAGVGVEALLVFCASLFMFMTLMVIVLAAFSNINNKWKIKQCAREYLLIAESQGCLTSNDIANMVTELNSYGLTGVDTSGTTITVQEYGDPVIVNFTGTFINNASSVGRPGGLFKTTTFAETLSITRRSTSKY